MKKTIVFVTLSLLIAWCPAYGGPLTKADFIEGINTLFLKGDYDTLVRNARSDSTRYRFGRKEKKEIIYLIGLSYINLSDFHSARKYLGSILKMKNDDFKEEAHIGIADSYFKEKNFDEAIKSYKNVLAMYPGSERASSVYYNLALCYKGKNDPDKANFYFQELKMRYEASFEAEKIIYMLPEEKGIPYYIIQLGAFNSLRNAKKLVRKLSRKKYDSYIQKVRKKGAVLYRVRGGKFSNGYYARRLMRNLKKDGFLAKIVME